MLKPLFLGAALVVALALPRAAQGSDDHVVRRFPAPELRASAWEGAPSAPTLAQYLGRPLLVYQFDWSDEAMRAAVLPVVFDLLEANADLELGCVGFANAADAAIVRSALEQTAFPHPIGLCAEPNAYFDAAATNRMYIIGPSGELLWLGDVLDGWPDFYANLLEAFRRIPLPALADECRGELVTACGAYYAGSLPAATAFARAVEDVELRGAVASFRAKIERAQSELVSALESAADRGDAYEFARLDRYTKKSLDPETFGPRIRDLMQSMRKRPAVARELTAAQSWFALIGWRPALYPARKDRDGDRFTAKARAILKKVGPGSRLRGEIEALVERYGNARE